MDGGHGAKISLQMEVSWSSAITTQWHIGTRKSSFQKKWLQLIRTPAAEAAATRSLISDPSALDLAKTHLPEQTAFVALLVDDPIFFGLFGKPPRNR